MAGHERILAPSSLRHHDGNQANAVPKTTPLYVVRRLMLVERLDGGTAGYPVGYQNPSQFSREYGRLHGRWPPRDFESMHQSFGVDWTNRRADSILPRE